MPTSSGTLGRRSLGGMLLLPLRPAGSKAQAPGARPGEAKPSPSQASGTPPFDVPALMARLAAVPERRAAFREEKRIAALTAPLLSSGTLLYRRPGRLEKLTDWPERESLVVDGDRVVLTTGNEPPRVLPLSADPGLRALVDAFRAPLAGDLATLARSFRVQGDGTPAAWQLDLTPTSPAVARFLRGVRVAGAGDELRTVAVTQANGDEQRLTIEVTP